MSKSVWVVVDGSSMLRGCSGDEDSAKIRAALGDKEWPRYVPHRVAEYIPKSDLDRAVGRMQALDLELSRILHEMAGAVSLCWEPKPTGVFDSSKAIEFVSGAIAEIRAFLREQDNG